MKKYQKGFATIIVFLVVLSLAAAVYFVPVPRYRAPTIGCGNTADFCPKSGWYLGPTLYETLYDRFFLAKVDETSKVDLSSPTPDSTADWKTFTSNTGKYSIKYPSTLTLTENELLSVDGVKLIKPGAVRLDPIGLSITFKTVDKNLTLNDYLNKNSTCVEIKPETGKVFTLDNKEGLIFESTNCGPSGQTEVDILNNGIIYTLELINDSAEARQIVSTFKFTDSASNSNLIYMARNIKAQYKTGGMSTTGDPANIVLPVPAGYNISSSSEGEYNLQKGSVKYQIQFGGAGGGLCSYESYGKDCGYIDSTLPNISTFRVWKDKTGNFAINPQGFNKDNYYLDYLIIRKLGPNTVFGDDEINFWKDLLAKIEIQKI